MAGIRVKRARGAERAIGAERGPFAIASLRKGLTLVKKGLPLVPSKQDAAEGEEAEGEGIEEVGGDADGGDAGEAGCH